jgi:hypothetical protein
LHFRPLGDFLLWAIFYFGRFFTLGDFLLWAIFTLGRFFEKYKSILSSGLLYFYGKNDVFILIKDGLGNIFGLFWTNSSGHPARCYQSTSASKRRKVLIISGGLTIAEPLPLSCGGCSMHVGISADLNCNFVQSGTDFMKLRFGLTVFVHFFLEITHKISSNNYI